MDTELAKLLQRACNHDEAAAAELIRNFEPALRRIIRFRLTDPKLRRFIDSLDICQSVLGGFFLQLTEGKLDFDNPKQIAGLLSVMAKNKIVDIARKDNAIRRGGPDKGAAQSELAEFIAAKDNSPLDAMANGELADLVRGRLSESDRAILDLWMQGHGWDEIATRINASAESLRKRLSRAIDAATNELGLLSR